MEQIIVLASQSPRRKELLQQARMPFIIRTANIDESDIVTQDPEAKVAQLAKLKGEHINRKPHEIILAADTVVAYQGEIFEKPTSKADAYRMLSTLSGNTHQVFTGVYLRSDKTEKTFVTETKVEFWQLTEKEINDYLKTDEAYDKAGAYGIQSLGALFVKRIIGDYYNVVGLPISRVVRELKHL